MSTLDYFVDEKQTEQSPDPNVRHFINDINDEITYLFKLGADTSSPKEKYVDDSDSKIDEIGERQWLRRSRESLSHFSKTQRWIGHVSKTGKTDFEAKLEDLTNPGTYEIGEFDMDEISPEDRPLVQRGATFYWSIGYSHDNGQISRKSLIRFQRILKWEEADMDSAADRARRLGQNLNWE